MARARTYRVMRREDQAYEIEAVDKVDGIEVIELITGIIEDAEGNQQTVVLRYGSDRDAINYAKALRQAEYDALNPLPAGMVWSSKGDEIDQLEARRKEERQQP